MVGGTVIETIRCPNKGEDGKVWVNCESNSYEGMTCAIYVEWCPEALSVSEGDQLWWQSPWAYWTPYDEGGVKIGPKDIQIPRASFSGVSRPDPEDR